MMSFQPHGFVYVASFGSANEHPLTPHGHVFLTLFRSPISLEALRLMHPITIAWLTQLLHSSTGLHIDNIIIHIIGDVQPNHALTNQFSTTSSKCIRLDSPNFHQVSRFISLPLALNYPGQAYPSHHNCMTLMTFLCSFTGDDGPDQV